MKKAFTYWNYEHPPDTSKKAYFRGGWFIFRNSIVQKHTAKQLTPIDKQILRNIKVNSLPLPLCPSPEDMDKYRSQRGISKILDIPYTTVVYRIKKLEDLGYIEIDPEKTDYYRAYYVNSGKIYTLTDALGMHFERGELRTSTIGDGRNPDFTISDKPISRSDNYATPKIDSTHHIVVKYPIEDINGPAPTPHKQWTASNTDFKQWSFRDREKIREHVEDTTLIIDKLSIRQSNCSTITATYRVFHYRNDIEHLEQVFKLSLPYIKDMIERNFKLSLGEPTVTDRGQLDIQHDPLSQLFKEQGIKPHITTEIGEFDSTPEPYTTHIKPDYMREYLNGPYEIRQLKEQNRQLKEIILKQQEQIEQITQGQNTIIEHLQTDREHLDMKDDITHHNDLEQLYPSDRLIQVEDTATGTANFSGVSLGGEY